SIPFSFLELAEGFEPIRRGGLITNKKGNLSIPFSFLELAEGFEPPTC
ncbi:MAG: hypothetical protein HY959_10270, partial [Ignavibacteriae bacterium]|nr:hypothetical protein [Ignavibacteriota bacterium]